MSRMRVLPKSIVLGAMLATSAAMACAEPVTLDVDYSFPSLAKFHETMAP
jgi:hypothetical protein